jgi:metal-sulfur cluster biosynthetic enzyme|tara:strand:- start:858 stop:1154 length:297 start_codon:yes stop_codon:yes gene_type:complete
MSQLEQIIANLRQVYDPEISVNIYDLGLIYDIDLSIKPKAIITHTLTSAFCPAADQIVAEITTAGQVAGITEVQVITTFTPTFGPEMMSEDVRLALGI